jgi:hypothetical protein
MIVSFILAFMVGALTTCVVLLGANLICDAVQRKKDEKLMISYRLDSIETKIKKLETKKRGK